MQLHTLDDDLRRLAARLDATPAPIAETPPVEEAPAAVMPPPLPPVISPSFVAEAAAPEPAPEAPRPRETFEMKLGTYWFVRVGIVMLLTGLVFLGTYAYKNFIGQFGAPAKVTLLYLASATLLGAGAWLQRRREHPSMQNYGQVLSAGGLAAVYFTTYAAHYVPVLRIIASPIVDGLLLLVWAAVTVWVADRRRSEVLALFAIGLAYYTSAITDVGLFTLGSNLLLTAAAVFFLVRHQWTKLSFISLVATYGGFFFWRFHQGGWSGSARLGELWMANGFLAGYWIFFTAAVFLARGPALARASRALFASLNNGAFFALVLLSMWHVGQGNFWKFSLGFGAVLLLAMGAARKLLPEEPAVRNVFLVQGLTLVTVGFIARFSGLRLALVLAAESVVLNFLGRQQRHLFLRAGAVLTGALSTGWIIATMTGRAADIALGASIAAALLLNAWWERRGEPAPDAVLVRPTSGAFAAFALLICAVTTWHAVPEDWRAVTWVLAAVAFTLVFHRLRVPEVPLFAQALAFAGQALWFFQLAQPAPRATWLVPALLVAATLVLSHWWQRQRHLALGAELRNVLQILYGLAFVGVLFFWLQPRFAPAAWLGFLCVLATGLTIYGVATRARALAACAQLFLIISSVELFQQFVAVKPPWPYALAPVATWLLLGVGTTAWLARSGGGGSYRAPLLQLGTAYRAIAFLITLWWVVAYVPRLHWFWVWAALGMALAGLGSGLRQREPMLFAGAALVVAFGNWLVLLVSREAIINWPNGLALVGLFVLQQLLRRHAGRVALPEGAGQALILCAGLALWSFVTRWVVLVSGTPFLVTVSWAVLAAVLFAAGFAVRERLHRWLGLAILGGAIGRVFLFDVWRLVPLYRILSFLALGVVLLALGFIYNKYQDKIRQWL